MTRILAAAVVLLGCLGVCLFAVRSAEAPLHIPPPAVALVAAEVQREAEATGRERIEAGSVVTSARPESPGAGATAEDVAWLTIATVDGDGVALDGCQLCLKPSGGRSDRVENEYAMLAVDGGRHRAANLPPGSYVVVAKVPSLMAPVGQLEWSGVSLEMRLVLAPRERLLGGRLVDAAGAPVANAFLWDASGATQCIYCRTDDAGRFLFARRDGAGAADAQFVITDELGDAGIADRTEPLSLAWGILAQVVHSMPRRAVEVIVFDPQGSALDEWELRAVVETRLGRVERTCKGVDGMARLHGVPTGAATLQIVPAPRWRPVILPIVVGADGSAQATATVLEAAVLKGRIQDVSGAGIEVEAVVSLHWHEADVGVEAGALARGVGLQLAASHEPQGASRTVENGEFVFGCDPNRRYTLRVRAPGYSPFQREVRAVNGRFAEEIVVLSPSFVVRGRLQPAAAGEWLARYRAQAAAVDPPIGSIGLIPIDGVAGEQRAAMFVQPDERGVFGFDEVPRGRWIVRLRGPFGLFQVATVELAEQPLVTVPPIELDDLQPAVLEGRLEVRAEGWAASRMHAIGSTGRSELPVDVSGSFRLQVPAGTYRLRVDLTRGGEDVTVTSPEELVVPAGGLCDVVWPVELHSVMVLLVDDRTGEPVSGAQLGIDLDRIGGRFRTWTTDSTGRASIFPCSAGPVSLSVMGSTPYSWTSVGEVSLGGSEPFVLRLPR